MMEMVDVGSLDGPGTDGRTNLKSIRWSVQVELVAYWKPKPHFLFLV